MVKQSAFQHELFDFKYIEDQVKKIKNSVEDTKNNSELESEDEQSINEILNNQLSILQDIQFILNEINNNTKKKKGWFNL